MSDKTKRKFRSGMYGGKFFPFHLGHLYCIQQALELCDKVFVILFLNGEFERDTNAAHTDYSVNPYLTPEYRTGIIDIVARQLGPRIVPVVIDVGSCVNPDGTENWDAETPLVLEQCGRFDAVFSSEHSYDPYFKSAYPWADHILVDPPRNKVPISATMIRDMEINQAKEWLYNE